VRGRSRGCLRVCWRRHLSNMGKKLANHPVIVLIGVLASILAIFTFMTGVENVQQILFKQPKQTPITGPIFTEWGEEGGIYWDSYQLNLIDGQLSYFGETLGDRNGLDFSIWGADIDPAVVPTLNAIVKESDSPPYYSNVSFITRQSFDNYDYCFFLIAGKAQVFIDNIEIMVVGFDTPESTISPLYLKQRMDKGEHEIRINLFEPFTIRSGSSYTENFEFTWHRTEQADCSYIQPESYTFETPQP
jgi:hypothetical protein